MGGRREVSIISHTPVTRSDLQQQRSFFRGSVSAFLQLVVALIISFLILSEKGDLLFFNFRAALRISFSLIR